MIYKIIRSLMNRKKKLYIVVNSTVADKGKISRACATVGMYNCHMLFSPVIVVRAYTEATYDMLKKTYKISGEHIDAGKTQVKPGTSLAFGVIVKGESNLSKLKLY